MIKKLLIISSLVISTLASSNTGSVLYIGDSHSYGKFGSVIDAELRSKYESVAVFSSCGSSARNWLNENGLEKTVCGFWMKDNEIEKRVTNFKTPSLNELLSKYNPNVTIVQLGTNMAASKITENHQTSVEKIMELISKSGSKCIWIGPPDANSKIVPDERLKIVNDYLVSLSAKWNCTYVDSLSKTSFPVESKEGIHYPPKHAEAWGKKVAEELNYLNQIL
jgi:hypothetical protein